MWDLAQGGLARPSRLRRATRFIPDSPESLESRKLLTAGPLGLNLSSIDYVDVFKDPTGNWGSNDSTSLTRDAEGWPTEDANILLLDQRVNQPWNGPDPKASPPDIGGTYHLSFHGRATVSPPSWLKIFTVQNQVYDASTNVTTADVAVQHNAMAFLQLYFTSTVNPRSPTGAGVTDVRMTKPGYAANTTQVFTNEYLNALKPFGTLRYMDVIEANNFGPVTNNSGPLEWSQRRLPSEATQGDLSKGHRGQAWEYLVALANATETDMWITVPGPATDDYVARLADLIKNGDTVDGVTYAGLKPGLKVYLEYSNEVWGGIYNPYAYNLAAAEQEVAANATAVNNDNVNDHVLWSQRRYLERTMEIGNIFRAAYGGDADYQTVRPVLGWQPYNWQFYTKMFPWFQATYGAPSKSFYGMGNAIYWKATDTSSVDSTINSLIANEAGVISAMKAATAIADYYGLKNVSYEGGPALYGADAASASIALAASRDPRMQAVVRQHYLNWFNAGGDVANFYSGPYEIWSPKYGLFPVAELSQRANPGLSPKYRGLQDVAAALPLTPNSGFSVSATETSSLSVTSDTLGQSFLNNRTGQDNYWLLNVATAGTYDLRMSTGVNVDFAARYVSGEVEVRLANQQSVGVYKVSQGDVFGLGSVELHAGLNVLVIHTVHGSFDPSNSYNYHYQFMPTGLWLMPVVRTSTFGSPSTSGTGTWTPLSNQSVASAGSGSATAVWEFPVTPGTYRVSASWVAQSDRSSAAPYSIYDGSNFRARLPVNQKLAPQGVSSGSTTWQVLGSDVTVLGNTLKIQLTNAPDGTVSAQSVRIERIMSINSPEVINANNDTEFARVGTWNRVGDYSYIPGASGWVSPAGDGSSFLTWTFTVTPGIYKVSTLWPGGTGFSTAAPYTISDGSSVVASVAVNQTIASAGYSYGSANYQDLSGSVRITGNKLVVRLASSPTGKVEGQAVRIQRLPEPTSTSGPSPSLAGFEAPAVGAGKVARPSGTAWAFSAGPSGSGSNACLSGNASPYTSGNPSAPEGVQVAVIQRNGSISQSVSGWSAGRCTISFLAAGRGNYGGFNDIRVLVDGVSVGTILPTGKTYQRYTTGSFAVTAGTHTITFQGLNSKGGDNSTFLDAISIAVATSGPSPSLAGFEAPAVGAGKVARPSGTAWAFSAGPSGSGSNACLSGNASPYTSGNPSAPEGVQVAVIQRNGSISQSVSGWSAGRCTISFLAAGRGNYGGFNDIRVLVDGVSVGTILPTGKTYQRYTTGSFAVTAGAHTITFQGLNSKGGDNSTFLDAISIAQVS
ncbi:hypothetical protein P12x_001155 [Tundrisphaera lichenicola]|uniref:golvesin C-terminal-like domain-containing protein n=1 Tax=Tundrisphaera lichenicola TaxID=2029860 RepID=UPI003EB6ADFE